MRITGTNFHERSVANAQLENQKLREQLNRYEAAMPSSPRRSWIPAFVRDARFDANNFTRWELARKIRYFRRNLWLIQRLQEIDIKYSVGPNGMSVMPASSDHEWNKWMLESYMEWCESPAIDSLKPMGELHKLWCGETHIDGEVFVLKTKKKMSGTKTFPKLQLVESHRVGSFGDQYESAADIVDGVRVDSNGCPISYFIRSSMDGDQQAVERSVQDVIHIYNPDRIGMYRAVTPYHTTLNTTHDLDDLEIFEMERAKENSQVSKVLKTPTGELNPGMTLQQKFMGRNTINDGGVVSASEMKQRLEQYRTVLGARLVAIKDTEELKELANENPSAATQWYWRYKISQVASAHSIPMMFILPESVQGTIGRAILDDANISFQSKFSVHASAARKIFRFYADWARYNDPRCIDHPADWCKCHVTPPRSVNVDYGRNSAATLAELNAGLTNWDDEAGAEGTTARELLTKKARNVGMIKQIASEISKEMGVDIDPAEIAGNLADVLAKLAQANAVQQQPSDKQDE